jgi:hypothetical protein
MRLTPNKINDSHIHDGRLLKQTDMSCWKKLVESKKFPHKFGDNHKNDLSLLSLCETQNESTIRNNLVLD